MLAAYQQLPIQIRVEYCNRLPALVLNSSSANRFYLKSDSKLFAKIIIIYLYIYNRYKICIQRNFNFLGQKDIRSLDN